MDIRHTYRTRQREILIEYLKSVPGKHITAGDVCAHFKKHGARIGQSTVYRQLEKLVDEGVLTKYAIDGTSPACFEYMAPESHADADLCYHCRCEKCGRLIHLHCEDVTSLQEHLFQHHRFRMDPARTVFYGVCEDCLKIKKTA